MFFFKRKVCISSRGASLRIESKAPDDMARTRYLRFASDHQPALVVAGLLRDTDVRALLRRLRGRSATMAELDLDEAGTRVLRRLRQVNLVTAYEIGGVVKYRARRWPPGVAAAVAA